MEALDQSLMLGINDLNLPLFLEMILTLIRFKYFWVPLYIFILAHLILRYKQKSVFVIIALMVCLGLSDGLSSHVLKPIVQRERPCQSELMQVTERVHCGSGYSFPSSHATNHFALALFFIFIFSPLSTIYRILLLAWAGSISFAQVFVGVHYPIDVLVGAVLGSIIGILVAKVGLRFITNGIIGNVD